MTRSQEKLLEEVNHKLTLLLRQEKTWIKVGAVRDLTGWNREQMRRARDNGSIEFRDIGNGLEYCLQSIPSAFLLESKNKSA